MKIKINNKEIFPIMGSQYSLNDFGPVDMSHDHLKVLGINNDNFLSDYLERCRQDQNVVWLTGGYLERRSLYLSSLFIADMEQPRDIHLGVDIWGWAGTPVYAPVNGTIHSYANNNRDLDYGYTLILEHVHFGKSFYTLYGHLGSTHFDDWEEGKNIYAGDLIAELGSKAENGGWIPHLHFQVILDMEQYRGDYPGVCSQADLQHYYDNCPDPNLLIKKAPNHDD